MWMAKCFSAILIAREEILGSKILSGTQDHLNGTNIINTLEISHIKKFKKIIEICVQYELITQLSEDDFDALVTADILCGPGNYNLRKKWRIKTIPRLYKRWIVYVIGSFQLIALSLYIFLFKPLYLKYISPIRFRTSSFSGWKK
ncbi:hypothetical protein D3C73_620530 [compost metagenome]